MSPSLDRVAGRLAGAVAVGGLLYGLLFVWIVEGSPDWVPEFWHALAVGGGLLTIPVTVALYQVVRPPTRGWHSRHYCSASLVRSAVWPTARGT